CVVVNTVRMERGFLSQKGSGVGMGVKEKQVSLADNNVENMNAVGTTVGPISSGLSSYPPLPTHRSTPAVNTPVMRVESIRAISERFANNAYGFFLEKRVAYPVVANYVRNTWGKYGLVKSMLNSSTGLFSFQFSSMDGLNAMLDNGPWFIRNHPLILKKWKPDVNLLKEDVGNVLVWVKFHGVPGMSSYARAMIELRADVELKDTIVVAMPKLTREGFYTCTVRVKYEWKPPRCACCKVCGHIQEECPKNPGLGVAKNLKKPSQASRGVSVGPKVDFKPAKEYRPVSKKPTANTSGNKKKGVEPTKEVSNSNPFDVLNSVENDGELGTNGGTSNLASNEANSSGSSFWNVETSSTSTTPIVNYPGDHDSEDEVESVDNDMARSMALERVDFGTKSLLEQ
ncbi:reverse transcriptase domain-containing protein, partial [Tanacetum coccineum]